VVGNGSITLVGSNWRIHIFIQHSLSSISQGIPPILQAEMLILTVYDIPTLHTYIPIINALSQCIFEICRRAFQSTTLKNHRLDIVTHKMLCWGMFPALHEAAVFFLIMIPALFNSQSSFQMVNVISYSTVPCNVYLRFFVKKIQRNSLHCGSITLLLRLTYFDRACAARSNSPSMITIFNHNWQWNFLQLNCERNRNPIDQVGVLCRLLLVRLFLIRRK